jgi:hypothetical protein
LVAHVDGAALGTVGGDSGQPIRQTAIGADALDQPGNLVVPLAPALVALHDQRFELVDQIGAGPSGAFRFCVEELIELPRASTIRESDPSAWL